MAWLAALLLRGFIGQGAQPLSGLPLTGEEAERYLETARVVDVESIPLGVTHPRKVTLSDGALVAHASFKTIDELRFGLTQFARGGVDYNYRDSFKHEIAAYALDRLIGAELVPPTVARTVDGELGSLQLWVEGAMSEVERQKAGKIPPLPRRFSEELLKVELFRNLTHDTDAANFSNILVDADFNVYAIDHSRAFRLRPVLVHEEKLQRFSRNILSRLRELDRAALEGALGEWLTGPQIEALLKRRDLIVERADRMVHEHGEGSILY